MPPARELFSPEVEALFAAGQESGRLAETMGHAACYLQTARQMGRQLYMSLVYPLALLLLLGLISRHLLQIMGWLDFPGEAPGALAFFGSDIYLVGVIVVFVLFFHYFVWSYGRRLGPSKIWGVAERLTAFLPLLPGWIQSGALSSAAASLSATLGGRLPLERALILAGRTSKSALLGNALRRAAALVESGQQVEQALQAPGIPRELRVVFSHASPEDLPSALSTLAGSAHGRARLIAEYITRTTFALALLLAATGIGAAVVQVWMIINSAPATVIQ